MAQRHTIECMKLEDLQPADYNPRRISAHDLKALLRRLHALVAAHDLAALPVDDACSSGGLRNSTDHGDRVLVRSAASGA